MSGASIISTLSFDNFLPSPHFLLITSLYEFLVSSQLKIVSHSFRKHVSKHQFCAMHSAAHGNKKTEKHEDPSVGDLPLCSSPFLETSFSLLPLFSASEAVPCHLLSTGLLLSRMVHYLTHKLPFPDTPLTSPPLPQEEGRLLLGPAEVSFCHNVH